MKILPLLFCALCISTVALQAADSVQPVQVSSLTRDPSPAAGRVAADLFWVADARKMDEFLSRVPVAQWRNGAPTREVLPETTTAWRDYAAQARSLGRRGKDAEAAGRLAQMIKLAAVYRAHGGLQNMVQAEEIRYLAGRVAEELGPKVTAKIQSPYMEKSATDCIAIIESWAGGERGAVSDSFWQQLENRALLTHARLTRTGKIGAKF
jgi:hypothetical protein